MEEDIKKLKRYLQQRLDEIHIPSTGGTVYGMMDKINALHTEIERFNSEDVGFANKILKASPHSELTKIFDTLLKTHVENIKDKFNNG